MLCVPDGPREGALIRNPELVMAAQDRIILEDGREIQRSHVRAIQGLEVMTRVQCLEVVRRVFRLIRTHGFSLLAPSAAR